MKLTFPGESLRPIGIAQLDQASEAAAASDRRRCVLRYHEHAEPIQRMLNALEPGTYVRPHRHVDPPKVEVFLALRGRAVVVAFDGAGNVTSIQRIDANGPLQGVEIPPGVFHAVVSQASGTVLYEVLDGPYAAQSHKDFADWAPEEGTQDAVAWLEELERRISVNTV